MRTAVILEDDQLMATMLADLLEAEGFVCTLFHTTDEAWNHCQSQVPDLLVFDWCVPGSRTCLELLENIRRSGTDTRYICVSGCDELDIQHLSDNDFSVEFMPKPLHFEQFVSDVRG
jgi:DNA-binding response OmpR family regulator